MSTHPLQATEMDKCKYSYKIRRPNEFSIESVLFLKH